MADHRALIDLLLFMAGARTFKCCAIKAAEWIDCIPSIPEMVIFFIALKCDRIVYLCRKPGALENPNNDIRKSNMKDQYSFSNLKKFVLIFSFCAHSLTCAKERNYFLFKCKLLGNDKYLISIQFGFFLSPMI